MVAEKPTYEAFKSKIKNLEKELESKNKYVEKDNIVEQSVLDCMHEGCLVLDKEMNCVHINNSAEAHSGFTKDEILGNKITEVWPGFEGTKIYQLIKDCLETGVGQKVKERIQFPNGKTSWYDLSIKKIPANILVLIFDITDAKNISEIVIDKRFQIVFESSNVAKSITLPTGELEINQAFCDMLGYTRQELQNKKWQDITPKEDLLLTEKKIESIFNGEQESLRFKKRYIHKNGNYIWTDLSVVIHRDENKNPLFFITTIIDITKQKEAEDQILYQKELLEEMGEVAKIGAWEFDPETGDGTWTDEVARIHDLKPGQKTNVELGVSFYTENSRLQIDKAIKEAIENKKPYELELEMISDKGNRKWVRTHGKPVVENNRVVKVRGSFQDITERKQILEKLRASETSMKNLLSNLPGMVYRCRNNKDWEMEFLSEGCYYLTGYQPGELVHNSVKSYNDLIHPEDREMVWKRVQEALKNNMPFEIEYRILSKDNKTKWVWERGKSIAKNNSELIEGFISDVTSRKIAEEEKNRYLSFLDTVFEQNPFPMWFSDTKGTAVRINKSLRKALNVTDKDIVGVYNLFNDKNIIEQGVLEKVKSVFNNGKTERFILKWDSKKVEGFGPKTISIWIDITFFPIIDQNNRLINVVCQWIDITEQKNIEDAIRENEKRLKNTQKIAKLGDYIWDIENDVISFSDSLKAILGYSQKNHVDLDFVRKNIHHPEDTDKILAWMQGNLKSESTTLSPLEYRVLRKDRTQIYVRVLGVIKRKNKKPTHVMASVQDITHYKLAELEINKLNRELEERVKERTAQLESINKELKTFTYTVSHDLKAPLRGIDGYSKLLQESYEDLFDDEGRQFLSNIREGTQQMNQLIEDLLTYSRLERSAMEVSEIKGEELLNKLLKTYKNELHEKQIKLNLEFTGFTVYADYNALWMALGNLLDNAVKFTKNTKNPEITIGFYEDNNTSTIFVKDNGIGFDAKYHNKIFEIFQRLQRVEDYPGTGIGLALVSKAMNRIGGRVWATSEPGKGATFFLELRKN